MLTKTTITLILTSLGIIYVEPQVHPAFQVAPSNTCVPCGGSAEFNCSTTAPANLGGGNIVEGVGGQLWMIRNPNGTVTNLSSIMPDMVPAGYEFVAPFLNDFTGLRVLNTTSIWNGTTFQCIAFDPSNLGRQNDSAAAVTLEVGGPPQSFTCELQCPDTYHPGTSDQCTIMWERLPTVSCDSLQFSVSLKQSDGTLVYSNFFGRSVYSAVTTTLNQNTVYTATIAAENLCGMANCTATNSTAVEAPAAFNVTAQVVFPSAAQEHINVTWTPPGPGDPLVDSYTVNVSSTDGQRLCVRQTTGGNATSVVLDVSGCVMCQGANKSYAVAVEGRNRGGQTTSTTSLTTRYIQGYQVRDVSADGQCALNVSCTVSDRTVATGCVFMYDSNGNGTLDSETLINLPMMGNTAESRIIVDCNLNRLNFTLRAVAGTTLSTAIPLDCPVSEPSFDLVSGRVCPALPDPQNGHVEYSNQKQENGTIATYSCNHLFMVNGNNERECQRNAAWSGSAPTCTITRLFLITLLLLPVAGILICIAVMICKRLKTKTKKVSLTTDRKVVSDSGGVELKETNDPSSVDHPRTGDDCTMSDKVLCTELDSSGSGKPSNIPPEESDPKV